MITQRIVNTYPIWTKIRKDPSSFGFRMNSVFGEHFDFVNAELKQNYLAYQLAKEPLGLGEVWFINLEPDDYMMSTATTGGSLIWTYPTVVADSILLSRIESLEELYWSIPTRIALADTLGIEDLQVATKAYLSLPVINDMSLSARLKVTVANSTNWFKKTALNNRLQPGVHRVVLDGYDINGDEVIEDIDVLDDSDYFSRKIYSQITDIKTQGFDGDVTLSMYSSKSVLEDPFHMAVADNGVEGPLYLELALNGVSNTSEITYYTSIIKQGENYKDGTNEVPYNTEVVWVQALLDSTGNEIEVVDLTINPNTTRLYVLDTLGYIHIYEYGLQRFTPPSLQTELTKATYVDIDAVQPWASYGETLMLFTRFSRPRFPVSSVQIKRISPASVVNYLQADKTWSATPYSFPGNPNAKGLIENTFQDITFTNEFDEFGQWEFYCTCTSVHDVTISYTGVMVDVVEALASLSTGITDGVALNYSDDNFLTITKDVPGPDGEANTIYKFREYSDVYLADEENQTLYLREEYASVEVS